MNEYINSSDLMSIEMTRQSSMEAIITALKDFRRTGERIGQLARLGKSVQALTLLSQEERNVSRIEDMLRQCDEGYLNPDIAKRLMITRNQFKEERQKMAQLFHIVRLQSESDPQGAPEEEADQLGFDYQLESRLLKEKEESLAQVHKNINNINSIMLSTQQMAIGQGEDLQVIGQKLSKTKENAVQSNKHLEEAEKHSASHNRSCIWLLAALLIVLAVIMLVVLFECSIPSVPYCHPSSYQSYCFSNQLDWPPSREGECRPLRQQSPFLLQAWVHMGRATKESRAGYSKNSLHPHQQIYNQNQILLPIRTTPFTFSPLPLSPHIFLVIEKAHHTQQELPPFKRHLLFQNIRAWRAFPLQREVGRRGEQKQQKGWNQRR